MKNPIIITNPDFFIWKDVTKEAVDIFNSGIFELYEVRKDGSDHLIEELNQLNSVIKKGGRICIEVCTNEVFGAVMSDLVKEDIMIVTKPTLNIMLTSILLLFSNEVLLEDISEKRTKNLKSYADFRIDYIMHLAQKLSDNSSETQVMDVVKDIIHKKP